MSDPRRGWLHYHQRKTEIMPDTLCRCGCGRPAQEIHHIIPLSEGGAPYDPANRVPLHAICHRREHKKPTFYIERN